MKKYRIPTEAELNDILSDAVTSAHAYNNPLFYVRIKADTGRIWFEVNDDDKLGYRSDDYLMNPEIVSLIGTCASVVSGTSGFQRFKKSLKIIGIIRDHIVPILEADND